MSLPRAQTQLGEGELGLVFQLLLFCSGPHIEPPSGEVPLTAYHLRIVFENKAFN